jgi:hypothetical protein
VSRDKPRLRVVPIELKDANRVVSALHRHHKPCVGHRFSLAVVDESGAVRGVAIVGRAVARCAGGPLDLLEVSRVATDGAPNACSMLLGAAARAGRALGYERIQTYTLPVEGGVSLRGAGWADMGPAGGGQWKHTDGKQRRTDQPTGVKTRWQKVLGPPRGIVTLPAEVGTGEAQMSLIGGWGGVTSRDDIT